MRNLGRPSPSLVISIVALLVALGGTGYAAVQITGKNVKDGSLTGKDVKNKSLTKKDFKGSITGAQGVQGAKGDNGDKGEPGAPATALWAAITSAGATSHGHGVASSQQLGPGQYEVIFDQDVTGCAQTAAVVGPTTDPAEAFASPRNGGADGVFVEIKDPTPTTGGRVDRNFNVTVNC
jgi:hypothetical protein